MITNLDAIVTKLSDKYNLPKKVVRLICRSLDMCIINSVKNIDYFSIDGDDIYNQPSFNVTGLGRLIFKTHTFKRKRDIIKEYKSLKHRGEDENKKD